MLRQLLSYSDNGQSGVIYPECVIYRGQPSEHGNIFLRYEPWLRQLLSSHDKGQSMVIYTLRYDPYSVSCYRLVTTVRAW